MIISNETLEFSNIIFSGLQLSTPDNLTTLITNNATTDIYFDYKGYQSDFETCEDKGLSTKKAKFKQKPLERRKFESPKKVFVSPLLKSLIK